MKRPATTPTAINKEVSPGSQVTTVSRPGVDEFFMTITTQPGQAGLGGMFAEAREAVEARGATIVAQDVFAPMGSDHESQRALSDAYGEPDWPVTWVDSGHRRGSQLAGTLVHAVAGASVERIRRDGRVVGSVYEDEDARYCRLGDMRPAQATGERTDQARRTFEMIESVLADAGMDFSNVVRTWIYLDDLLDWYGPFNGVRTGFFTERGVFDRLVPASTGISGANPSGTAMIASALAVAGKSGEFMMTAVASPLQCPALKYGSSFSRAVELGTPGFRRMSVSGTASIEPGGQTAYLDDIDGQIKLTADVVEAILESRQMNWSNVVKAIAYVKEAKYTPAVGKYCSDRGLTDLPMVITENHVCRHDLLFEMELDAVATNGCAAADS